jgi:hypothetical protein
MFTKKLFKISTLLVVLIGVLMIASTSSVLAQLTATITSATTNVNTTSQSVQVAKIVVTNTGVACNLLSITVNQAGTFLPMTALSPSGLQVYKNDISPSNLVGSFTPTVNSGPDVLTFLTPVAIAATPATMDFYVVVVLNGPTLAVDGTTMQWNIPTLTDNITGANAVALTGGVFTLKSAIVDAFYMLKAEAYDLNKDGKVDAIKVYANQQIDDNSVLASNFVITHRPQAGGARSAAMTGNAFDPLMAGLDVSNNSEIWITFTGAANTTGDFWEVQYTGTVWQNLTGAIKANAQTVAAIDKAAPVITGAVTGDANNNGFIDGITLTFSEAVTITDGNAADGLPDLSFAGGYAIANADYAGTVTSVTIGITEKAAPNYDTGEKPAPTYTANGATAAKIADREGIELPTGSTFATTDGCPPRIVSATYLDKNGNGKLDAVQILFTEKVRLALATQEIDPAGAPLIAGKDADDENGGAGVNNNAADILYKDANAGFTTTTPGYTLGIYMESVADNTAAATNLIELTVTGPGAFDTGVKPVTIYTAPAADQFEDLAANSLPADPNVTILNDANIVEIDGAKPIVSQVITEDNDANGKLDQFLVTFSEPLNPATVSTTGWTFTSNIGGSVGTAYSFTGVAVVGTNDKWAFAIDQVTGFGGAAVPQNTSDRPNYSYAVNAFADPAGNKLGDIAPTLSSDGAPPVIVAATITDEWRNGAIAQTVSDGSADHVIIKLTEALTPASVAAMNANNAFTVNFAGLGNVTLNAAAVAENAADGTSTLKLSFIQASPNVPPLDTDPLDPATGCQVSYVKAVGNLVDANNGQFVFDLAAGTIGDVERDGMSPVLISAETFDLNKNGKLDHYRLTFTEKVKDATFSGYVNTTTVGTATPTWAVAGYTNVCIDPTVVADATLGPAGVLADADNDEVVWLKFDEKGLDTDAKPDLTTAGATLTDNPATGKGGPNVMVPVASASTVVAPFVYGVAEADAAKPILWQAIGQATKKIVFLFFSEPVEGTGAGLALTGAGDVTYSDINGIDNANLDGAVLGIATDATNKNWQMATVAALSVDDVTKDKVSATAGVQEAGAGTLTALNLGGAASITINDIIPPTVTSVEYYDNNSNGLIDLMKVTFDEAVDDTKVDGYAGANANGTNVAAAWQVAGHSSVKYLGVNATQAGLGDADNDNVVWFILDEKAETPAGDTKDKPAVTTASTLADFKPNVMNQLTGYVGKDKAGPAIMGGGLTKTVGPNAIEVQFSEPVRTALAVGNDLATTDFTVTSDAGTVLSASNVLRFIKVGDGSVLRLIFDRDYFADGAIGSVAFSGAGVLGDLTGANAAASNSNTQTATITLAAGQPVIGAAAGTTAPLTGSQGTVLQSNITRSINDQFSSAYVIGSTRVSRYEIYASATVTDRILIAQFAPPSTDGATANTFTVRFALTPPDTNPRTYYVRAVGANSSASGRIVGGAIAEAKIGDNVTGLKVGTSLGLNQAAVSDLVVIGTNIVAVDGVAPSAPSNLRVIDDPASNGLKVKAIFTKASDDGLFDDFAGVNTARFYRVLGYNVYNEANVLVATIPAGSTSASFDAADRNVHTYTLKATDGINVSTASNAGSGFAADNTQVADFNSDRTVDVSDLALFAGRFGQSATDSKWEPMFDLNHDGKIDVSDLALFASRFGQSNGVIAKEAALPTSSIDMQVRMVNLSNNRVQVVVESDQLINLKGYQFALSFDKSKVNFESVEQGSAIANKGLFIQKKGDANIIVAAGAYDNASIEGKATLATFNFKLIDANNISITVDNIILVDAKGDRFAKNSITSNMKVIPTEFALSQNYPNPFNPSTEIRFDLPVTTNVRLSIFNIQGQEIRTLINGNMEAGAQHVTWDGTDNSGKNISSGVYFYRISADKFSQTKKMMLLK